MVIVIARSLLIAVFSFFWFSFSDDLDVLLYRSTGLSMRAAMWFSRLIVSAGLLWIVLDWAGQLRLKRSRFVAFVFAALTVVMMLTLTIHDQQIVRGDLQPVIFMILPFSLVVIGWLLPQQSLMWKAPKWLTIILSIAVICIPFILHPPNLLPGIPSKTSDVNKDAFYEWLESSPDDIDISLPNQLIAFYSPSCRFCRYTSYKVDGFLRRNDVPTVVVFPGSFSDASPYFTNKDIQSLPAISMSPTTLFSITNRRVPMLLHMQYGEIKDVYRYNTFDDRKLSRSL